MIIDIALSFIIYHYYLFKKVINKVWSFQTVTLVCLLQSEMMFVSDWTKVLIKYLLLCNKCTNGIFPKKNIINPVDHVKNKRSRYWARIFLRCSVTAEHTNTSTGGGREKNRGFESIRPLRYMYIAISSSPLAIQST